MPVYRMLLFSILLFPLIAQSEGEKTLYTNGVEFSHSLNGAHITLNGPDSFHARIEVPANTTPFIDIQDVNGESLPDGLYRYELRAIRLYPVTRSEHNNFSVGLNNGRGTLEADVISKYSPISGNFRIVNGETVDPDVME